MAVRLQFVPRREPPDLLDLPWSTPLAGWDDARLVRTVAGESRHVVRFVAHGDRVYALKEMPEADARREYAMLRGINAERLPAVEAVGLVSGREDSAGRPLDAVLVTLYLDYALPFRYVLAVEPFPGLGARLLDAAVVLLTRLHLDGVYWGDCSLSNLLFRRDAGALTAYLVDAETARRERPLPDGMRHGDLELARENVVGGLLDLRAEGRIGGEVDPVAMADLLEARYRALWDELTGAEEVDMAEGSGGHPGAPGHSGEHPRAPGRHFIDRRIRRLNELGFDVAELLVEHDAARDRLRLRPVVVEDGHHSRALYRLTGLEVQENQARRLLNDITAFGAHLSGREGCALPEAPLAARWMTEVYQPIVDSVPPELRGRLEAPELFHELLEHRYYLSEDAGREVDNHIALRSYVESVLRFRPRERLLLEDDGDS